MRKNATARLEDRIVAEYDEEVQAAMIEWNAAHESQTTEEEALAEVEQAERLAEQAIENGAWGC